MNNFGAKNWKDYIPEPIFDSHPEYNEIYMKAWELAYDHIKFIEGMPQNPYMDEAFCDTQIWIWDTCFMALFCKYAREVFPGVESLKNFYEALYEGEHLAWVIPTESEPEWTRCTVGKPYEIKVHIADNPPLFAWAEYENALMLGDKIYLKELLYDKCYLQKHYEWFENLREFSTMRGVNETTCLIAENLGYKWEGGRSGMDNTPRGRIGEHAEQQRPNNPDMLWIDAICQQALSAKIISLMYKLLEDDENAEIWDKKHLEKKKIVNDYYWDESDKFYYDIDCKDNSFYKIKSIASFWTLTAGIASKEQAQILAEHLENPETFGGKVPFVSLSCDDNDFSPYGEYWRGSVWLPTAYAALKGLKEYGFLKQAYRNSLKLIEHMYKTYAEYSPHTIWETYSPSECIPASTEREGKIKVRPDFCGWSALGPISVYIEFVLGFHAIDAFKNMVEWELPDNVSGKIGIKNLRFGNIVTDIEAVDGICTVTSTNEYTLKINGNPHKISEGFNKIIL